MRWQPAGLSPDRRQAYDLEGSDVFLPPDAGAALLADKALDADERLIEPLPAAGKAPVTPSVPGGRTMLSAVVAKDARVLEMAGRCVVR